jgi:hypothetical protein
LEAQVALIQEWCLSAINGGFAFRPAIPNGLNPSTVGFVSDVAGRFG